MTTYHKNLRSGNLHVPGFVRASDPGVVGSGLLWVDKSAGAGSWVTKIRNDADDGWENVGVGDHSELTVLNWASAGHTIDTDIDMVDNGIENLRRLIFDTIPATPGSAEGTVSWNEREYNWKDRNIYPE